MGRVLLLGLLAGTLRAQDYSLDVVPLQSDPDQIARSLRDRTATIPEVDCAALDLWECHTDEPKRSNDVSLRWVQLDDDPELEAVLVANAPEELATAGYVFDRQDTWRLVGSFICKSSRCDAQNLTRVGQLTKDSPVLLWVSRDIGGSGAGQFATDMFQLWDGKLRPVIQFLDEDVIFPAPPFRERTSLQSSNDRIVIHTTREQPPGQEVSNKCEVRRWDAAKHTFVAAVSDQVAYCNLKTGKPIPGRSSRVPLPAP